MPQEDAMNMSNEQAIQILKPFRDMMIDQHGCPISDAVFALDKAIEALSVQPEQQWIPCSDRMPDQYGNYLVSIEGDEPDIGTINPNNPRGWSLCDASGFYWASDKYLNITAWMPLPEPYREEGEE